MLLTNITFHKQQKFTVKMEPASPPGESKASIPLGHTTDHGPPDTACLAPPETTDHGPPDTTCLGLPDESEVAIPLGHTTYLEPVDKREAVIPLGLATYLGSFPVELHDEVLKHVLDDLPIEICLTDRKRFTHMNSRAQLLPPVLFINKSLCLIGILTFFRRTKFVLDGQEKTWKPAHENGTVPSMRAKFIKFMANLSKIVDGGGDSIQCAVRKFSFEDVTKLRQESIPVAIFCKDFSNLQNLELGIFFTEVLDTRRRRHLPVADVLRNLKLDDIFELRNIRCLVIRLKVPIFAISPDMCENRVHKVNKFAKELKPALTERFKSLKKGVEVEVFVDKQQEW